VFGCIGDLLGRKKTFLATIIIMGLSTFLVGLLPSYHAIGLLAPTILVALRLLQGLAVGGEYGGAATFIAEHTPIGRRGYATSWLQTTTTMGLLVSILIIICIRSAIGNAAFDAWGWRIPFLLSAILLVVSTWMRAKLHESPVFQKMKAEGQTSRAPLRDSFGHWPNVRLMMLALIGLTAGEAVVGYTSQFYSMFFLTRILKMDMMTANLLFAAALVIGTPFYVVFGWLSDRVGRKPIIMLGCLLGVVTFWPSPALAPVNIFRALTRYGNPALFEAAKSAPVIVVANPSDCSFQFNPVGTAAFNTACDIAKSALVTRGIPYKNQTSSAAAVKIEIGATTIESYDGSAPTAAADAKSFASRLNAALAAAGYPKSADPAAVNKPMVLLLLVILIIYLTMVYGPICAILVEMFPPAIRYTSMSLPYQIGNGWFGGFAPPLIFALVAANGDIYFGLWYPVMIAAVTLVVGTLFVREPRAAAVEHVHNLRSDFGQEEKNV
jgi:MFS family permease